MKTLRNIIIILIALFLAIWILQKVQQDAPVPVDETPVVTETKLVSLKGVEIFVTMPLEGSVIGNPLVITGRAPGNWFFEASAPATLTNWDGLIIGQKYIQAEGEWMTTDYVPFTGTITYEKPICDAEYCTRGTLILQKDNPSGESQFDDSVEISIKFE